MSCKQLRSAVLGVQLMLLMKPWHHLWKLNSVCHGNFDKIQEPDPKSGSFHADVYGHAALLLEGHLLQASQTKPQDNPLKRSLCSSGQACIFQIKVSWVSDCNQKASFHSATFPLMENKLQEIILLTKYYSAKFNSICPWFKKVQRDMCSFHCH